MFCSVMHKCHGCFYIAFISYYLAKVLNTITIINALVIWTKASIRYLILSFDLYKLQLIEGNTSIKLDYPISMVLLILQKDRS